MEIEYMSEMGFQSGSGGRAEEEDEYKSDSLTWGVSYLSNRQTTIKENGRYSSLLKFDAEHFILISELTETFYQEVESLANAV